MAVLIEATSVVVQRDAIFTYLLGGWEGFVNCVPNRTLCTDNELARVSFMNSGDVAAFTFELFERGLVSDHFGVPIHFAVIEQSIEQERPCPWLEVTTESVDGAIVVVARKRGSEVSEIALPPGWSSEKNIHQTLTVDFQAQMEFVRREGNIEVYRQRDTGREAYVGRTLPLRPVSIANRLASGFLRPLGIFAPRLRASPTSMSRRPLSVEDQARIAAIYRQLAEQGETLAQYELARMLTAGYRLPNDHVEAAKWYRRAADKGMPVAQYVLGVMYEGGQGVEADLAIARKWYALAAEAGLGMAAAQLGLHYFWGRDIKLDHKLAADWFRRGAELGDAMSQHSLATQLRSGDGVPEDIEESTYWLRRSAKQGFARAHQDFASAHWLGQGVEKDFEQAYFWISVASVYEPPGRDRDNIQALRKRFSREVSRSRRAAIDLDVSRWRPKIE